MSETSDDAGHTEADEGPMNRSFSSSEQATTDVDPLQSSTVDASTDAVQHQESAVAVQTPEQSEQNNQAPNGHSASQSQQQNGTIASADLDEGSADSGAPQEPEDEPWRKRLYFVRMPKFPEDNHYATKVLQEEIDVYRSQVQLLNESMNVVRVSEILFTSLQKRPAYVAARSQFNLQCCAIGQHSATCCFSVNTRWWCCCRCSVIVPKKVLQKPEIV